MLDDWGWLGLELCCLIVIEDDFIVKILVGLEFGFWYFKVGVNVVVGVWLMFVVVGDWFGREVLGLLIKIFIWVFLVRLMVGG